MGINSGKKNQTLSNKEKNIGGDRLSSTVCPAEWTLEVALSSNSDFAFY